MAVVDAGQNVPRTVDEYMFKIYKTSFNSPNSQRLPKAWNVRDRGRYLRLSQFYLTAAYSGAFAERHDVGFDQHEAACVRADVPIPLTTGIYYFEVTISGKSGDGRHVAVGISTKASSLIKLPGYDHSSFGYHNDGSIYHGGPNTPLDYGPRFIDNDTIGCGVDFLKRCLFFTRNGILLGKAFEGKLPTSPGTRIFPIVGLQGRGTRVTANFGQRPFLYAFDVHMQRERTLHENLLIERKCKEEFAGAKMIELISGYLIHHGYVTTTQALSRWNSISLQLSPTPSNSDLAGPAVKPVASLLQLRELNGTGSSIPATSTDCQAVSRSNRETAPAQDHTTSAAACVSRSHSDSSLPHQLDGLAWNLIPGVASMVHRRRLRALCRRCQYGRAAAMLSRLYPQVLEHCPELTVQLRCRQLIEMMRRHAIRRGQKELLTSPVTNPQNGSSCTTQYSERNSHTQCCLTKRLRLKTGDGFVADHAGSDAVTTPMDVDGSQTTAVAFKDQGSSSDNVDAVDAVATQSQAPPDEVLSDHLDPEDDNDTTGPTGPGDLDAFDDDSFGIDDDTGVCLASVSSSSLSIQGEGQNYRSDQHQQMEVDHEEQGGEKSLANNNNGTEIVCLLRHVQFGRALVNLVKQIRSKTGGLSFETEQLLQQSVSLLAYPSPASMECPLRSLLDPVWRETVASFINSAVLKAQNLPTQPALEDGLRSLHKCFQDAFFVEAQTLGHFLLYHLTPDKLDRAERLIALAREAEASQASKPTGDSHSSSSNRSDTGGASGVGYQPVLKRQRISASTADQTDPAIGVANGHQPAAVDSDQTNNPGEPQPCVRRRAPRRRRVITVRVTTSRAGVPIAAETSYPTTTSSSSSSSSTSSASMEDVTHLERDAVQGAGVDLEEDEEEEEEDDDEDDEDIVDEEESCHVDDADDRRDNEDGDVGGGGGRGGGSVSGGSAGAMRGSRGYQQRTSATTRSQTRQQSSNRGAGVAGDHVSPNGRTGGSRMCPPFGLQFLTNVRPILMQPPESTAQQRQPPRSQQPFLVGRVSQSSLNSRSRPYVLTAIPPLTPLSSQANSARSPLLMRQRYSLLQPATALPQASQTVGVTLNTAFSDLLSLAHPQHIEFLAAMDDALKAYTGSALVLAATDNQASSSAVHRSHRYPSDDDPSAGAGTGSRLI